MSKMTCAEAIFDLLAGKYAGSTEHECFDDIFMACMDLAAGQGTGTDVPAWIAARDKERSEEEVCLDICDYFRRHHGTAKPSVVMAQAITAGRNALREGQP